MLDNVGSDHWWIADAFVFTDERGPVEGGARSAESPGGTAQARTIGFDRTSNLMMISPMLY